MSVKRYDMKEVFKGRMAVVETSAGAFVSHGDYAVLEQKLTDLAVQLANAESKCRELAAENAGLKELIEQHANSVAVCPNCSHEEPSETDDIVALYRSMETPATDAFLAEVRAQGVESGINTVIAMMNHQHPATSQAIDILQTHAAQIRKGAAL